MCSDGRIDGASTSEPIATWTKRPLRTTEKSSEPHVAHLVWLASSSPIVSSRSEPLVIASFSRSIPANGLKADPVAARHREQWQLAA